MPVKRKLIMCGAVLALGASAAMAQVPPAPFDAAHVGLIHWNPYMVWLTTDPAHPFPYVDLPVSSISPTDNVAGNPSKAMEDLVGDATHPTAYWAIEYGDDWGMAPTIMFRMRVDGEPDRGSVWTVLLNTNPTQDRIADHAMVLDTTYNPKTGPQQVEGWAMSGGSPANYFHDFHFDGMETSVTTQSEQWMLKSPAGSYIDGDGKGAAEQDWFVSMAMPLSTFLSYTGLEWGDSFKIAMATSEEDSRLNKDLPDYGANYTWDVIVIPEPFSAMGLCALLSSAVLVRSRRNRGSP